MDFIFYLKKINESNRHEPARVVSFVRRDVTRSLRPETSGE